MESVLGLGPGTRVSGLMPSSGENFVFRALIVGLGSHSYLLYEPNGCNSLNDAPPPGEHKLKDSVGQFLDSCTGHLRGTCTTL